MCVCFIATVSQLVARVLLGGFYSIPGGCCMTALVFQVVAMVLIGGCHVIPSRC